MVIDAAGVRGMEDRLIEAGCRQGRVMFVAERARVGYDFNLGQMREIRGGSGNLNRGAEW